LAALTLLSAYPADASGKKDATRTCREGDNLVKLADERLRCFEKGKVLPKGAVVVDQKASAAAPRSASGTATSTLPKFAEAAEACLKEAGALSEAPGQSGGFVGKDGRIHFTSPNDVLAAKCKAAGNAANRPERWK